MTNRTEQDQTSTDVNSESLQAQFTQRESQIAYDSKNREFIAVSGVNDATCTLAHYRAGVDEALTKKDGDSIIETTDIHRRIKTLDLLIDAFKDQSLCDILERTKLGLLKRAEADAKKMPLHYFADTWNILRFVKGSQSMGLNISPNGLNLNIMHGPKGDDRQREDELVLTNMSFTSGLHYWEIVASIGCNNIQVGVHNPISKTEVMASFKTKSKRVITVCLNLYEGVLKFWLNDQFIAKKVTKLFPVGGPWVPCVKIGKERNCLTLNPFANPPSIFAEASLDRGCRLDTILMPLLTNFLCVTGLPPIEAKSQIETLKILNQIFQHSNNQISDIHMPAPGSKIMFCFIKFHHYSYMAEFLDKHRPAGKFKIYEAHEIFEWFINEKPPSSDLDHPFAVIKKAIGLPLKSLNATLQCIQETYSQLTQPPQSEDASIKKPDLHVDIVLQVFSDKLIVAKSQSGQVKAVTRSPSNQQFDMQDICFSEEQQTLNCLIELNYNQKLMQALIEFLPWAKVFKKSLVEGFETENTNLCAETAYHGLYFHFFKSLGCHHKLTETQAKFYAPIFATKQVLDSFMFHLKKQLKHLQTCKDEQPIQLQQLQFKQQQISVDELMQLISFVSNLQEQLWAKTRSEQCLPEVKYLCQTVSRPSSALNRLGSFVQWPFAESVSTPHSTSPFDLADNGFYLKSNEVVSTIYNPLLEIQDFTPKTLSMQKSDQELKELLGQKNAFLSALPSQNTPLYKSLNYLAPQKFTSVSEVICSQNTGFVLVGGLHGSVSICSSQLQLMPIKNLQFFSHDVPKKKQKYLEVYQKLEARNQACIEYQQAICKKEQQIPFIQELFKRKSKSQPKKKSMKKNKSKTLLSPVSLKANKKQSLQVKSKATSTFKSNKTMDEKSKSSRQMKEQSVVDELKEKAERIAIKKHNKQSANDKKKEAVEPRELKDEKIISINKEKVDQAPADFQNKGRQRTNSGSLQVLGYILLSKQATIDPLMVGCIYQSQSDDTVGKFFIKLRRLMFQIPYLLNFIHGSQLSGNLTNLVSGYQSMQRKISVDQLETILRHQDVLLDLVPVFVRTQVTKKQYPKWESKFPMMMLSEVNEAELELNDVDSIIDFTNSVYSVTSQNHIHILCSQKGRHALVQLRVDHQYGIFDDSFVGKIKLAETARIEMPANALRVFQVDEQVAVLCSKEVLMFKLDDLQYVRTITIQTEQSFAFAQKAQICNETDRSMIYTAKNVMKFREAGKVPQQQWTLCLINPENQYCKYPLIQPDASQLIPSNVALRDAILQSYACEIEQITEMIKAKKTGLKLIAYPDGSFQPNCCVLDTEQNLYSRLFFKKVTQDRDAFFEFTVELGDNLQAAPISKQLELEFSFKCTEKSSPKIEFITDSEDQVSLVNLNQTVMRLPLLVEHLKGSQSGEVIFASHLTTPDQQVFVSMYPQPEFTFRHAEGTQMILTQINIWSKVSKESQGGFPIGQGFIFFANSLADLMDSAAMKKQIKDWSDQTEGKNSLELKDSGYDCLYFNFDHRERMTIDLANYKTCKFLKIIPTGFRSKPINYADCQEFQKDQAELQFFGVSGYILESLHQELQLNNESEMAISEDLNVNLQIEVHNESQEIASADTLSIDKFRSNSPLFSFVTAADSVQEGIKENQVGLATIRLPLMPEEMRSKEFKVRVKEQSDQKWILSGITLSVDAIQQHFNAFYSPGMAINGSKIIQTLMSIENVCQNTSQTTPSLEELVEALLEIIEGVNIYDDAKRMQAVLCLSKLVFDSNLLSDLQRSNITSVVKSKLNVTKIFQYSAFVEHSSTDLQKHLVNLIELVGLKRKEATRKATNLLITQVFQELSFSGFVNQVSKNLSQKTVVDTRHLLSIDMLKNVLNLVSRKRRPFVVSKFTDLIINELQQTVQLDPDYFKLRSELEVNAFPFDIDYLTLDQFKDEEVNHMGEEFQILRHLNVIPCDFQMVKINSSYSIKAALHEKADVSSVRLLFRMNSAKSIHKFRVSIILHDQDESPLLLFARTYDESMFVHVTKPTADEESSRKKKTEEELSANEDDRNYFDVFTPQDHDGLLKVNKARLDQAQELPFTYASPFSKEYDAHAVVANRMTCQLNSSVNGKLFEVQVELLDTYRTINKAIPFSQVLITPEFIGSLMPTKKIEQPEQSSKPLNQDLEDLQMPSAGESLSLSVPSLDIKNRQKTSKDAAINKQQMEKQPFIPNKYLPSKFISRTTLGAATYDIYSGLAADKTMKSVQNHFMFKYVAPKSKLARSKDQKEKKLEDTSEQVFQDIGDQLLSVQSQLREELQKERTVKDSKSGMARILQSCQRISQLKRDLRAARHCLPIDHEFFNKEVEAKASSIDQNVERPGFRKNGYQTFVSQVDAQMWLQLSTKNKSGILKYAFALSELACVYLHQVFVLEPQLINEPASLFKKLFKVFIAQEAKGAHPIVEEFLQALYKSGLGDKDQRQKVIFDLVHEILIKPTGIFNFGNFLDYIQSDRVKFISINDVLNLINSSFNCQQLSSENGISSEQQAIEFLRHNIVNEQFNRIQSSTSFNFMSNSSSSGMAIAALSFFQEHVSYRLRICNQDQTSVSDLTKAKRQLKKSNPELMEFISLSNFTRFAAWQIYSNPKLLCGLNSPKSNAFLLCLTEAFLKLTTLNMERLGQRIHSESLKSEDWLIVLLAVTQSGQAKIHENFTQAVINLMLASQYQVQKEIVHLFNYCLAFLLTQDVSLSQKVYRKAELRNNNGFSLLFSHYQSLVRIQTKVINVISSKLDQSIQKVIGQDQIKEKAYRKQQTIPTMSKEISDVFVQQIEIQNMKLGDFIYRLLTSLNLIEDNSASQSHNESLSQIGGKSKSTLDFMSANHVLVEIYQSLTFLKDLNARKEVTKAIVRQLQQLKGVQQLEFSKSVLQTSEQLVCSPEKMKINSGLIISLVDTIITNQLLNNEERNLSFFQVVCRNLLTLLLTGSNSKDLPKRIDIEKQQQMHRKETAATYLEDNQIEKLLSLLTKFVLGRCQYYHAAQAQTCTVLLDFSIANKLCELCLYSKHINQPGEDDRQNQPQFALNTFSLNLNQIPDQKESAIKNIRQLLEFIVFNQIEEDEGVKPAASSAFKVNAKTTQICQKIGQIIIIVGQVNNNAIHFFPALMELAMQMDRQIAQLVKDKKILDLRAIQLQQNANQVFQKMLLSWISGSTDDEISFTFLNELKGFNFIISRLDSVQVPKSPQISNRSPDDLIFENFLPIKQASSEDDSSDTESQNNLMNFLGKKIGLPFIKAKSNKVGTLSLQDRRDTELLAETKVKILLRKQTAVFKPKEKISSQFDSLKKKKMTDLQTNTPATVEDAKNLGLDSKVQERIMEKNYANTMKLVDCTEGQEVVNERMSMKWGFKAPNTPPIQLILGNNDERKQEYQLTFDLSEIVQFTEIGVQLELPQNTAGLQPFPRNDKKAQTNGKQEYPYAIIIEGKRSSPFLKTKQQPPVFWNTFLNTEKSTEVDVVANEPNVESFLLKPEQTQETAIKETPIVQGTVQDNELREQMKELTIGNADLADWSIQLIQSADCPSQFSISQVPLLSQFDTCRYEAQFIKFRFLYMDQIMCTIAATNLTGDKKPADKNAKGALTSQRVINLVKLNVMGANCLDQNEILAELAQMKRKNAMTCLAQYFTKAPKGVLARITKDAYMQRSFINSFDVLEPFLLLNSSVILPIFIQMASMSESLCTELMQTKILLDFSAFKMKHSHQSQLAQQMKSQNPDQETQKQKELEVMLTLYDGLVMSKTDQGIHRLSSGLNYVISQSSNHIDGVTSPEAKLHINFIVGVANLFVECASLIAKEMLLDPNRSQSQIVELQVSNKDIFKLLSLAAVLQNQSQQKSLILLAIFLLQLPQPLKATEVDSNAFLTEFLLPNCQQISPSSVHYLHLLSLMICNRPAEINPIIKNIDFVEQILTEILNKVQSKSPADASAFTDDHIQELIHVLYNCIECSLMNQQIEPGFTLLEKIAYSFYDVLKPQKVDGKVVIGAEKIKFQTAQALAKTLIQIINRELLQSQDSKSVESIIKQIHQDIFLTQTVNTNKKKKVVKKADSSNIFVTLVFEPLLKLKLTVPIVVNSILQDSDGKVKIQQFYKQTKQKKAAQSILPTEALTKDHVDMFLKALKLQNTAHGLNLSEEMFKNQWQNILDVDCKDFPNVTVDELVQKIKKQSNLLYVISVKVDSCQNNGLLPESDQYVLQMCFFSPSMLEQPGDQEEISPYGSQLVLDPNPKENKGSFFFVCAPDKIGSTVFIYRDNNNNQYKTDFQLQKFDVGDNQSNRYSFYMMNQIVTSWSPKLEANQQIWLNFNEHLFQNEDENFKKVFKQIQYKQGVMQRFSIFKFNATKVEPKHELNREIGVPKYQLVGSKQKESKKGQKFKQDFEEFSLVDPFSSLSVLNQNLVLQVPVDCRLDTLAQILNLPKEAKFVNLGKPTQGLNGSALESTTKIGELVQGQDIIQLFSQTPAKELTEETQPASAKEKDAVRVFKKLEAKIDAPQKEETQVAEQTYDFKVFSKYLSLGGSEQMIEMAQQTVSQYRNKKMKDIFSDFLKDLKIFSILPGFSDLYFKPQDKKEMLLELLKRDYADIDVPKKKASSEHSKAQKEMGEKRSYVQRQTAQAYEVIETLFMDIESLPSDIIDQTISQFIRSGVLQNLLQSISTMSGEFSRKKINLITENKLEKVESNQKSEEWTDEASSDDTPQEEIDVVKVKVSKAPADNDFASEYSDYDDQNLIKKAMYDANSASEESKPKKYVAKKGVGYTTGVGEIWDVNAYLKLKETKNASLLRVFRIIQKFLHLLAKVENNDLDYYDKMRHSIIESAVLPTIESALRSGSLLEMAKEMELYQTYLQFIEKLASIPSLFDLILELPQEYEPAQRDSILSLLVKNKNLSEVFVACLDQNESTQKISKAETEEVRNPKQLATLFIEVTTQLSKLAQQKANMEQQRTIESILALPIDKQYLTLLEDQRFNYQNFRSGNKATDKLDHYHAKEEATAKNPPSKKLIRLAQEIADLTNSLPVEYTSAIFCRVDKKRVDFMKCLIMGATGTPYANGAFTFDIFFNNKYPEGPPKVQLTTTGGGQVRFNPNLYACGKVCLSLLGTWRGQATENWDSKVSTTLQVLMSIQAIIMSNEVYFNEPGYEQEAGTVDGEKRNTGYSNIIRYATAKYAILEHLQNPTKGFEQAIHRSFFVKKDFILDEIDEWIKQAEKNPASYQNLVLDHNYNLGQKFQKEGEYLDSLKGVREEIKVAFDKLKLESSGNVSYNGKVYGTDEEAEERKPAKPTATNSTQGAVKDFQHALDQVDVSYETTQVTSSINIDDEKVKDRWSRYIGAMGIEAVAKQAESTVFISGLGPLGVEIAKNIILAGCKELVLYDSCQTAPEDLDGQFFLEEKDISSTKTRAQLSQMKIQELNTFVKVTVLPVETDLVKFFAEENCRVKVAVFTDQYKQGLDTEILIQINEACRNRTQMIVADNCGLFTRIVTDFGPNHTVIDQNGEPAQESIVESIQLHETNNALVTLIKGAQHGLQEGDTIELAEVKGMLKLESNEEQIDTSSNATKSDVSVNGNQFKVLKVITTSTFVIDCDTRLFSKYARDGLVKQIKIPITIEHQPLRSVLSFNQSATLDQNLIMQDFDKIYAFKAASICFKAIQNCQTREKFIELCQQNFEKEDLDKSKKMAEIFWQTGRSYMPPLCAFLGGVVAQEVVKGITQKFTPIKQEFYFDAIELYQESPNSSATRYRSLYQCIGQDLVNKVQNTKLFMIGAGAIGCELLKNFAMIGLGSGSDGLITLTDPDVIEVSNLNRQFLFREKHLRKPKSITAAAASIQMNPNLKGHIDARLDKVHAETNSIYSEEFFQSQHVIANALDNVQARIFIDQKCINARVPLLDSGTLGPKGHVQVIIPFKTESYASQADPEENLAIPHCTLKMFPEETLHCVEWAKDLFGTLFTLNPQNFNKLKTTDVAEIEFHQSTEFKNISKVIKSAQNRPRNFDDCIKMARQKFQKYFHDNILQLLHVYPLDKTLADGRLFWTLPKRPPTAQLFDPDSNKQSLHRDFIAAYACLTAKIFGIKIPFDSPRGVIAKQSIAKLALNVDVKPFISNDQKANQIEAQVDKQNKKTDADSEQIQEPETTFNPQQLKEAFEKHVDSQELKGFTMYCEEFEKDDDQNFHIDFIYACANIRALNYGLKEMDWLTVKLKAGRIVPALATTTAAIAGLQTIELLKLLKRDSLKLADFKNTFLNLAVPSMMSSEPGVALKTKIKDGLETDLWDRWSVDISQSTTMAEVLATLQDRYKLSCRDIIFESTPLFMYALRNRNLTLLKQPSLQKSIVELLQQEAYEGKSKVLQKAGDFSDLTITFVDQDAQPEDDSQEMILQNIPTVRVTLK